MSNGTRWPFQQAFEHFLINPVTSWDRFFNPQIYVSYNSGDVDIENHVLRRAGSYGRQLGRVLDVLDVLVARLQPETLTPAERLAVDRFRELSRNVDAAVVEYRGTAPQEITRADVERVIDGLLALERTNPAAYRELVTRLREAVAPPRP
jgi:hypothetical protein